MKMYMSPRSLSPPQSGFHDECRSDYIYVVDAPGSGRVGQSASGPVLVQFQPFHASDLWRNICLNKNLSS